MGGGAYFSSETENPIYTTLTLPASFAPASLPPSCQTCIPLLSLICLRLSHAPHYVFFFSFFLSSYSTLTITFHFSCTSRTHFNNYRPHFFPFPSLLSLFCTSFHFHFSSPFLPPSLNLLLSSTPSSCPPPIVTVLQDGLKIKSSSGSLDEEEERKTKKQTDKKIKAEGMVRAKERKGGKREREGMFKSILVFVRLHCSPQHFGCVSSC